MDLPRRRVLRLAAGAAVTAAWSSAASAQNYPSRYVRLVVPFPPGGGGDALGRPLANRLSELWGQQVVIENKAALAATLGLRPSRSPRPTATPCFWPGRVSRSIPGSIREATTRRAILHRSRWSRSYPT